MFKTIDFRALTADSAVSSGAAIQPAQPGNSHRADDAYISHTGDAQKAGGLAAQEAAQVKKGGDAKNLIAFDLFQESAGLKGMNIRYHRVKTFLSARSL